MDETLPGQINPQPSSLEDFHLYTGFNVYII